MESWKYPRAVGAGELLIIGGARLGTVLIANPLTF